MARDTYKREGRALRFFDSAAPDDGLLAYGPAAEYRAQQLAARNPGADLDAAAPLAGPVAPALAALVAQTGADRATGMVAGEGGGDTQAQREAADRAAAEAYAARQREASVDPAAAAAADQQRQAAQAARDEAAMRLNGFEYKSPEEKAALERQAGRVPADAAAPAAGGDAGAGAPLMSVDPNFGKGGGRRLAPTPGGAGGGAGAPGDPGSRPMTAAEEYERDLRVAQQRALNRPYWSSRDPGGTFARARTVQASPGPDPALVRGVEAAEHQVGMLQDAGAWIDTHEQQDLTAESLKKQQLAEQQQAQRAELEARRQEKMTSVMGAIEAQRAKVASMTVDPQAFWKSKTAGEAVGAGIAVILSDIGNVFMGRAGGPNRGLEAIQRGVDQEIERQVRDIGKAKGDLTDMQQLYQLTKEQFGDENAALTALQMSAWEGVKYRLENVAIESNSQRAQLAAQMVGKKIDLAQADRRMQLDAAARGSESTQFEIRQPRVVSGGGPDEKRFLELGKERVRVAGDSAELDIKRQAADGKAAGKDQPGVMVDGHFYASQRGIPQSVVEKATDSISFADSVIETIQAQRERAKKLGGNVPNDPVRKVDAFGLANGLAQAFGGGVASESDKSDMIDALSPGPRQGAALDRIEKKARLIKTQAIAKIGAKPGGPAPAPAAPTRGAAPSVAYQPSPLAGGGRAAVPPPRPAVGGKKAAPLAPSPLMSIADIDAIGRRPPANTGALDDLLRRQYGAR
jgi:hypothetical protein